jgi:hypothetical protein
MIHMLQKHRYKSTVRTMPYFQGIGKYFSQYSSENLIKIYPKYELFLNPELYQRYSRLLTQHLCIYQKMKHISKVVRRGSVS